MRSGSVLSPKLVAKWQDLHAQLLAPPNYFTNICREPFLGYRPKEMDDAGLRFAYIGKATGGGLTSDWVSHTYRYNSSPFWTFARELRDGLASKVGESVVFSWSNVCKIGITKGNPRSTLFDKQKPTAIESLRHEMQSASVDLVVLVCEGFADQIIYDTLNIAEGNKGGHRDFEALPSKEHGGYVRPAMEGFAPILWLRHPQGKLLEARALWVKAARDLMLATR